MVDKKDFRAELAETAKKICTSGKGILAADESEGTIGKKFAALQNVENNAENRRRYREVLLTTPDFEKYISGVIFFQEQVEQGTKEGITFPQLLVRKGVIPGIKVDKGLQTIPGTQDESSTKGLDSLAEMCKKNYALGCRFAKWRSVLKIDPKLNLPSEVAIKENAWQLGRYAAICQENGLVPIVEPEILSDGDHSIDVCQKVTERVLSAVFRALQQENIFFEGCLLKPNMVTPGGKGQQVAPEVVAQRTLLALSRTAVPSLVGVVFLSGGQSEESASVHLNAMNIMPQDKIRHPYFLTFSYGRALQNTAVKTWNGKDENKQAAQQAFIERCRANGAAQLGVYGGSKDPKAMESLFVENYKY